MSKYIYNPTLEAKTYEGNEVPAEGFYLISAERETSFASCSQLISDLASSVVKMSSNGTSALSGDGSDHVDFLKGTDRYEVDTDGRQIIRAAAGKLGWTYFAHPIEFETSKIDSLYEKDRLGNSRTTSSIKFYDANDVEVVDSQNETSIIKTVVLFKPSYDYELVAGNLQQIDAPSTDVRLWVVGGLIELGGPYVKEFAGGLNMRFFGANESVKTDGRAAKYMKKDISGVPYQGNQLQVIVRHDAGYKHKLMLTLEYFRA